ncbi:MAG: FlgD immunoglobulin-like domain containing protein [Candidatus Zixiibacteriota bacterium]
MKIMRLSLAAAGFLFFAIPASATVWVVNVQDFSFSPKNLTVMQGDTVRWQRVGGTHTTTSGSPCSPDGLWSQVIDAGHTTYQRQFSQVGTFPYYCIPHCEFGMTGTITVDRAAAIGGGESGDPLPRTASLEQNYPNPFNAATEIYFDLTIDATAQVAVFDILGRTVRTLESGYFSSGRHHVTWDATDADGRNVPTGVYFFRLVTDREAVTRKMVLLR